MRKPLRTAAIAAVLALALTAVGVTPAVAKTADSGTVSIKVVAPGGTPIPKAYVSFTQVEVDTTNYYNTWSSGDTDTSGVYKSDELAPGTYDVTAGLSVSYNWVTSKPLRVTVTANSDSAATLTFDGVQAIKGTVKAKGKAVGSGWAYASDAKSSSSAEIVKGSYVLFVKPGTYSVQAFPDYNVTSKTWLATYSGNTVRPEDAKKVKVAAAKASTVNIAAYDKVGKISGRVLDAKGKAVKGAIVNVWALNRSGGGSATTDAKGNYTVSGLPADTYEVSAWNAKGTAEASAAKTKVSAGKTAKATIKLKTLPVHKGKVVVTLTAPKAIVKDGRACASLLDSKGNSFYWSSGGTCLPTNGKKKTITFEKVPAGKYTVAINGANTSKSVTVKKNKTTKVSLKRAAGTTISGKITTSAGKALAKTYVYVYDSNGTWLDSVQTSAKGTYKVSGAVKGKYSVRASAIKPSQGATTTKSVTVASKKKTLNVKLIKAATITGKVVNSKGKPVAGVNVSTYSGNSYASTTTDAKGKYTLSGLAPGTYQVTTFDYPQGGYFHGKSVKKKVATGKKVAFANIKLKG